MHTFEQQKSRHGKVDPFTFFDVNKESPSLLYIRVGAGRHISKGMIGDLLDTPDPYISVYVSCAAKKTRKTKHFNNVVNPQWNEELRFHVPPLELREDDKIVISLMGTVGSAFKPLR